MPSILVNNRWQCNEDGILNHLWIHILNKAGLDVKYKGYECSRTFICLSDYPILNGNFSYVVNIELYIWPTANYKCIGLCKQAQ
jgi:hypothetical protein